MSRCFFAFDVDGTLIDTRPSFNRVIHELSGATLEDIERFRDNGGFNDDWELTRALVSWIAAGRPKIVERCESWRDVVLWCGNDPGDLSAECMRRYRSGYWRDERVMVDGKHIAALAERHDVAVCTGRDAWELARAHELLGYTFTSSTTAEQAKKPDPQALLRLLPAGSSWPVVVLFGDTHADRRTIQAAQKQRPQQRFCFVHVSEEKPLLPVVEALLSDRSVDDVLLAYADKA